MLPGVLIFSLVLTILNSLPFLTNIFQQRPGFTYLGVAHYWQDYFFYVNHFFQGAHGVIFTKNQFTSEITSPSIIYWPNILLGKIGGIFSLSPIYSYNLAIIVGVFCIPLLIFLIAKKLFPKKWQIYALLIVSICATGFFDWSHMAPYELWRTPHVLFNRLGGVPLHLLQTINVFILFYLEIMFSKKSQFGNTLGSVILLIILTTMNPVMAFVYLGGLLLGTFPAILAFIAKKKYLLLKKYLFRICVFCTGFLMTALYMQSLLSLPPHSIAAMWEASQQVITTVPFLFLSMGPIAFLFFIGIIPSIRKKQPLLFISVTIPLVGYTLFLSPMPEALGITNTRFIFPGLYLFMGIIGVEALTEIYSLSPPWKSHLYKKFVISVTLFLFLLCSSPAILWEIQGKVSASRDTSLTTWIPNDIYAVYQQLSTYPDFDAVAIANPPFGFDTLIPALSGHTTYSGHMLTTIDNGVKQTDVIHFFDLNFNPSDALTWLRSNAIRYVIYTHFDGDRKNFESSYPFLETVFSTPTDSLYRVSILANIQR